VGVRAVHIDTRTLTVVVAAGYCRYASLGMLEPGTHGLDFAVPRDRTSLADGAGVTLPHRPLQAGVYPMQWTQAGAKEMEPRWWPLWDTCVAEYNAALAEVEGQSAIG
jgi:hypothetical protein